MTQNPGQGLTTCPYCGAQSPAFAGFCGGCGRALATQAGSASRTAAPGPAAPPPTTGYGPPPGYGQPQGYGTPPGFGSAPAYPAARSRTPVLVALGLVALVVVLAVGVVIGMGIGAKHSPIATIVYQLQPPSGQRVIQAELDATVKILQDRLGAAGASGTVEQLPPDRVSVEIDDATDVNALFSQLGARGLLEFVLLPPDTYGDATGSATCPSLPAGCLAPPADGSAIDPSLPAQFTGADLDPSGTSAEEDPANPGSWMVIFAFAAQRGSEFAIWSGLHVKDYFAIVLDGVVLTAPYIAGPITGGQGQISGNFTEAGAKALAGTLKSGALPVPLQEVSMTSGSSVSLAPQATGEASASAQASAEASASASAGAAASASIEASIRASAAASALASASAAAASPTPTPVASPTPSASPGP